MTRYLTAKQYRSAKSRLTRAVNSGDPQKVLAEVAATFVSWDNGDYAYPDDWHRWQIAADDASNAIRVAEWENVR